MNSRINSEMARNLLDSTHALRKYMAYKLGIANLITPARDAQHLAWQQHPRVESVFTRSLSKSLITEQ